MNKTIGKVKTHGEDRWNVILLEEDDGLLP